MERRLTAILAADVVGYTRLMGLDETGTLRRLTEFRQASLEPLIEAHGGRIAKLMGDGLLVEFPSVVDALTCAIGWQEAAQAAAMDGEERQLLFRIGLNLGDVIVEGGDIHGDGVNVAARLEALAPPGGICLSADVRRLAKGRVKTAFVDLGELTLKNVAEPVHVFRVAGVAETGAAPVRLEFEAETGREGRPSIAVLPFDNMSGDPEQGYFADGITEDIITDLAKIPDLCVIARNSSFSYKGRSVDVRQVCQELGVSHVLEGSVRRAGDRVRITAQLIDGATGGHLWADRYDHVLADILAVQDDVTRRIVQALEISLARVVMRQSGSVDPIAYDLFLQAREQYRLFTRASHDRAYALYRRAIAHAPDYADPLAGIAEILVHRWFGGDDPVLADALDAAARAKAIDPHSPFVSESRAVTLLFDRQHDAAMAEVRDWLALNPGDAEAYAMAAGVHHFSGEHERVAPLIRRATELNPFYPFYYTLYLGKALLMSGQESEARATIERAVARNPETMSCHLYLAICRGLTGDEDGAAAAFAEVRRLRPGITASAVQRMLPYRRPQDRELLATGLRAIGLDDR